MDKVIIACIMIASIFSLYILYSNYKIMKNANKKSEILLKYENESILNKKELEEIGITGHKDADIYLRECKVYRFIALVFTVLTVSLVLAMLMFDKQLQANKMLVSVVLLLASAKFYEFYRVSRLNLKLSLENQRKIY